MRAIGTLAGQLPEWICERVRSMDGELRPGAESADASRAQVESYGAMPGAQWRFYYADTLGMNAQPWHISGVERYHWWIVRLDPGCVFPLHVDTFDRNHKRRLWVPLTPPTPGHVFEINGAVFNDFVVGSVYEFDDRNLEHGAANFSREAKISLQIVVHE